MIKDIMSVSVMYHGQRVGTLTMGNHSCCQFEYDPYWLRDGFSISPLQLPLKAGLFSAKWQPFNGNFGIFEDSLPGGYGEYLLRKVMRREGIDYESLTPVQRLSLVGSSGMGALCYVPESKVGGNPSNLTLDEMQAVAIEVLSERTDSGADMLLAGSGNSGGVRPKCLYNDADGHWLVKFRHTFDPMDIGRQEYHYNELAQQAGIVVPEFRLMEGKYFATRRFDIDEQGNRLHMATASGLLNEPITPPKMDYHSLLQLTGYLTQSPEAVEQQFRRMVFNHYAHNYDDHARNFSFLFCDGHWELAPAYDLTNDRSLSEHATTVNFRGLPTDEDLIAVGTTSVRTLESLYWFGVKLKRDPEIAMMHIDQWDPYLLEPATLSAAEAFELVLRWMQSHDTDHLDGETQLMIAPGYRYHVVDCLITNFHQPRSTLLLLVSALIGDRWHKCYRYALDHGFRFLSYGDSCLFMP